jgi:kynurenine formamidase
MASRAQGLCARLALCLLLLAAAVSAAQQACDASESAAASPQQAAAAGWHRALQPTDAPPAGPRIIDISVALDASTPKFSSPDGLGKEFRVLEASQAKGDAYTSSLLRLGAHTGTHVDSPGHFIAEAYAAGAGVDRLDLYALNGPVLVVDISSARSNITAQLLAGLQLPQGVERLIFKTDNTVKGLMHQTAFDSAYTGFTADGARWLADNMPSLRAVGIDYLSIATLEDIVEAHIAILGSGIVAVEGLVLDAVQPGIYTMHALPLKIVGADGAPARVILMP